MKLEESPRVDRIKNSSFDHPTIEKLPASPEVCSAMTFKKASYPIQWLSAVGRN
jgi:hypothetical protein